jgi:hypothetical protein
MTELATRPPADPIPVFASGRVSSDAREAIGRAVDASLLRSPSPHTWKAYGHDLNQFLAATGVAADAFEQLAQVRPERLSPRRRHVTPEPTVPNSEEDLMPLID